MRMTRAFTALSASLMVLGGIAAPAAAQQSCSDLYNRTMTAYQTYGAGSPQYAQLYDQYTRCSAGNPLHAPGQSMLSGTHNMPGTKAGTMGNQAMPERSPACTPEALATMPPEHRLACERAPR